MGLVLLGLSLALILPTQAQSVKFADAWQQVYAQMPMLPKENQYIDRETKRVEQDNTFVGRLISYHIYVKGRPPALRLDWKHTIADYLGANEAIDLDLYPTQRRLQTNPLEGDRAVIQNLTRGQRDQLIQALIVALSPQGDEPTTGSSTPVLPSPTPVLPSPSRTAPQPGGADLLK
jgi:hypothetical protein